MVPFGEVSTRGQETRQAPEGDKKEDGDIGFMTPAICGLLHDCVKTNRIL